MTAPSLPPRWRPAAAARRLATLAALFTAAAALTGSIPLWLMAVAALALAAARRSEPPPDTLDVRGRVDAVSCLQGDELTLHVTVRTSIPVLRLRVTIEPGRAAPAGAATLQQVGADSVTAAVRLRATRRGRGAAAMMRISLRDRGGGHETDYITPADEIRVFPRAQPWTGASPPPERFERGGIHPSQAPGSGTEFAGLRPFQPGDSVRQVHWPVSTRLGRWYVTERAVETSVDVVVGIDAFSDVSGSLDRAASGAATVALAALARGDRVGVILLGGRLRWWTPQSGMVARARVMSLVTDVRRDTSVVTPDITRIPRAALPGGCSVIMFTPLLDSRAVAAVNDLAARPVRLVVVDVLTASPPATAFGARARRRPDPMVDVTRSLWQWDRESLRARLTRCGADVIRWDGDAALGPLLPSAGLRLRGRRAS